MQLLWVMWHVGIHCGIHANVMHGWKEILLRGERSAIRFRRLIFSFKAIKTLDKVNKKAYTAPEFEVNASIPAETIVTLTRSASYAFRTTMVGSDSDTACFGMTTPLLPCHRRNRSDGSCQGSFEVN